MDASRLFELIESRAFATRYTILSGWRILQLTLVEDADLQDAIQELKQSPRLANAVTDRIEWLLTQGDGEHLNPYDVAITAYLYCLDQAARVSPYTVYVVLEAHDLWWARRYAKHTQDAILNVEEYKFQVEPTVVASGPSSISLAFSGTIDRTQLDDLKEYSKFRSAS